MTQTWSAEQGLAQIVDVVDYVERNEPVMLHAERSATLSVPNGFGSATTVTSFNESETTGAYGDSFDAATGVFTMPENANVLISVNVQWSFTASVSKTLLTVLRNGTSTCVSPVEDDETNASSVNQLVTFQTQLSAGDTISMAVEHDTVSGLPRNASGFNVNIVRFGKL